MTIPPSEPTEPGTVTAPATAPPQWAWAQPQPVYVPVETEPLEYHRLYRGAPKYRWWKPLLVFLLAVSYYLAMNLTLSLLFIPLLMVFDPEYAQGAFLLQDQAILDTQHPWSLVMSMTLIILFIPAVILAMLSLGIRPTGRVWSVAGRIRWGLLGRTLGAALVGVIVMNGVGILADMVIDGITGATGAEAPELPADFDVNAAIISMVLVVLLVPFQAAAEEVAFRGLLLQVFGSWMKSPWLAIGLSTVAFAAMHIYDIWGLIAVGLMGLVAAWLTWKTGGLEAAIAIHVLNNLIAFAFMASGITGETAQVESGSGIESIIGEIAGLAVFAWLVIRIFRKHGYGRERIDVVMQPVQPSAAAPVEPQQQPQPTPPVHPGS
ncbi:CPBP family intramembrane glutamic endopeptidase [Leucobacter denitrificans]|uniref:CPBP family intramembrane metalloprotease n=1 Tax=Leucobacter denitrificans TaxID=683042 RepID=A0A7G9S253_9MICO|nr:type II CAAX endopeptidase family protein [Leucobacter denitrificans]QNN61928.1 CPBP family intramembrane metalloprotease [Leucobacter denitrificans]